MRETPCQRLAELTPLLEGLGSELDCPRTDGSSRLVAIHYWLSQIEDQSAALFSDSRKGASSLTPGDNGSEDNWAPMPCLASTASVEERLEAAIALARHWLETSFAAEGEEAALVSKLRFWLGWMRQALRAHAAGRNLPPWPAEFSSHPSPAICRAFLAEAEEWLNQIESAVLAWATNPPDKERIAAILRPLHTFKGSAGLLGLEPIAGLAHATESLLSESLSRGTAPTAPAIECLLDVSAWFRRGLGEMAAGRVGDPFSIAFLKTGEILQARMQRLRQLQVQAGIGAKAKAPRQDKVGLRVDAEKLDRWLELFEQWEQMHAMLTDTVWNEGAAQSPLLFRDLGRLYEMSRELKSRAVSLRRTSLQRLFEKLGAMVATLAPSHGKTARVVTAGQEVEVDLETAGGLEEILVHLVRNSLAHGIEKPAARRAAGKTEMGTISLAAASTDDALVIEVRDDGAGLDIEKILERAAILGWSTPGSEGASWGLLELLCQPGFSTAETPTAIAGRGIGLDAVKQAVARLHGRLELESGPGLGTTVRVCLPVRSAAAEGMQNQSGRLTPAALPTPDSQRGAPKPSAAHDTPGSFPRRGDWGSGIRGL